MTLTPLAQRIFTAVALIAVLLPAFLFLPKWFGEALMTLFVLRAGWEWSAFPGWHAATPRLGYVAMVAVLVIAAYLLVPTPVPVGPVLGISMAWWAVAFVLIVRFPLSMGRWAVCLSGLLVIVPAWICLVALLNTEVGGRRLLLVFLAVVWAADVGAYFAGRRFGRVKLASLVSPGKTWEGVFGGLAAAMIAASAGAAVLGRAVLPAIPLGVSVAAISIVGDLTVSVFKRSAGLKDSGNLFPGHGGVLDRIDSVAAAAPLFVLEAGWLGWLGQ